jgi:hypothetical protein
MVAEHATRPIQIGKYLHQERELKLNNFRGINSGYLEPSRFQYS